MKPAPMTKVNARSATGPVIPTIVAPPRMSVEANNTSSVARMIFRRSTISASVPATNPKRRVGAVLAVCTSATISGEGVSVAINHAAMVACMV